MKKGVYVFSILVFSLMLVFPLVIADNETTSENAIDKAYECLEDKVVDNCDTLSLEEKIFSLLALGECKDELIDEASGSQECWPSGNCDIKFTAMATLALNEVGSSTTESEEWLLDQYDIPSNVDWFLEIENPNGAASCTITYSDNSYDINIGENRKINSGAGSCLSLESHGYWLKIAPSCYDNEFKISCDEGFLTTLLFKKDNSPTIHVSEAAHSASAEGQTIETVNSLCFAEASTCNYEGSLWASFVLDYLDYDVSAYIPYLVTMAEDNEKYLPEGFLFLLTGYPDFRNTLLGNQKNKYWDESGDKFYDTALVLYSLYENSEQEQNSEDWLLEVQGDDGCWDNGNTRNTAFILYSVWPKSHGRGGGNDDFDCEAEGYFCVSKLDCEGTILSSYEGCAPLKCCTKASTLDTCSEQGGKICNSIQTCSGSITSTSNLDSGETCCITGSCITPSEETDCEKQNGICRISSCYDDEDESNYDCDGGDTCCVEANEPEPTPSYWWIWLLLFLIILVVLAIIFRDRLRPVWLKVKSKFKKGGGKPGVRGPPSRFPPSRMPPRPMQRRILPPGPRAPPGRPPVRAPIRKPKGDIDDVLKKLKAMGK